MNARTWDRLAALLSIVLLSVLALATYYLAEFAGQRQQPQPGAKRHEPDAFVESFGLTRIDETGRPVYRVEAKRSLHYPDDDSTELFDATVVSLDPQSPRIVLRADRGVATSRAVETRLYGNVELTRAPGGGQPAMQIITDYALVLSEPQIVRTDRPVRITQGQSFLTGVGMEYDHAARQLRIDSQVRGSWYDSDRKARNPKL